MENNLDKYFRDRLHHREFELNEAHWAGAEQLLRADEERRRFFWWFGAAGVLLLAAAVAGFLYFSGPKSQNAVASGVASSTIPAPAGTKSETHEILQSAGMANMGSGKNESSARESHAGGGAPAGNEAKAASKPALVAPKENHPNVAGPIRISPVPPDTAVTGSPPAIAPAGAATQTPEQRERPRQPAGPVAMLTGVPIFPRGQSTPGLYLTGTQGTGRKPGVSIGVMASQLMLASAPAGGKSIIGFQAGVVVEDQLKNGWFVASGLQYQRRTGTFEASKMVTSRSYRFGLELAEQQLRPSSLHYLQLPVKMGWQRRHHLLEGGLLLNYLAGVRGAKGSLERTGDVPPRKEFVAAQKGWIAEDGYKKWHVLASAGYHYRVSRQLSFGLSANYAIGGILEKNYLPPAGKYLLKEDNRFYLSAGAVYFIK